MDKLTVLINEAKINARLDELAKEIMRDYKDEDIVFVGVLRGAAMFMVELAKRIKKVKKCRIVSKVLHFAFLDKNWTNR